MPGAMPYLLDKGPYFEVIEDILSNGARRIAALGALRNGAPLAGLVGFDSDSLSGDGQTMEYRVDHLYKDWFGMIQDTTPGPWHKQPGVFPTGFWRGYQGDPEAILRETMERAIELSLGLAPGAALPSPNATARDWPIDVYWICQGPWFQCWVLWREGATSATGHVTVLITTRPVNPNDPPYTAPDYESPPAPGVRNNHRGMWVIGHEDYEKTVVCSTVPGAKGSIEMPRVEWRPVNPNVVVRVSPAEWEGGVLADGRAFVP
jgi:hypothetical protein